MKRVILFDLSEVLIAGLLGVEQTLAPRLHVQPASVLSAVGGDLFDQLCRAEITEAQYLQHAITNVGWKISTGILQSAIRENFYRRVTGMDEVLAMISTKYELFLLSDHAREWIEYIHAIHPFLGIFRQQFFSFDLAQTKQESGMFHNVLGKIHCAPEDCLFIDDNPVNIQTAAQAGIDDIQFGSVEQLIQNLLERSIL